MKAKKGMKLFVDLIEIYKSLCRLIPFSMSSIFSFIY